MSFTPNLEDRERDKFVESPTRPGFTAIEVLGSFTAAADPDLLEAVQAPNLQGVNTILNLTTTAQLGKVGAAPLVGRTMIEMQALTSNVKWGYSATTCFFDLFKNQFFALPMSEICEIYFAASSGTAQVVFSEK